MDERVIQFRVGVLVVATAAIAAILVMLFESRPLIRGQYAVFVRFNEAPGVAVGTPVRKSGILIGRVSQVELTEDGKVTVVALIDHKYKLRTNETCRIASNAILGDSVMEFIPGREPTAPDTYLADGDLIQGSPNEDPFKILVNLQTDVTSAVRSIDKAGTEVQQLAKNANSLVEGNGEQFERILKKTEVSLDQFNKAMSSVDELVGDPEMKKRMKQALDEFPQLLTESRQTVAEARTMIQSMDRMSVRAERNLANIEGFTKPLGERGDKLVTNLEHSINAIDTFLTELTEFSRALNSGEGTLGKLVHENDLYDRLESALTNVDEVTRQLKPAVHDVRVFADKIARDPSRLGVKGALDRQPTGLK